MECPAFVCFARCFLSLSLLPLHHSFTHIYLQEREVNAILQDIANSRQNIQQSLSGVSTVLLMSLRHTPCSGRTVLANVRVPALKQGNSCLNEKWWLKYSLQVLGDILASFQSQKASRLHLRSKVLICMQDFLFRNFPFHLCLHFP